MTPLEELKEFNKEKLRAKEKALEKLLLERRIDDLTGVAIDLVTEARELYRITVIEARFLVTIEEVAARWKETHELFRSLLRIWGGVLNIPGMSKNDAIRYCDKTLAELESASAQAYQFHT